MDTIVSKHTDISEFVIALLDGVFETPLWKTFLELLRSATAADFAILLYKPPGWRHDESLELYAGDASTEGSHAIYRRHFTSGDPVNRELIIEGRTYSLQELRELDGGVHKGFFDDLTTNQGITALRQIRVQEARGVDAWLTIARRGEDFEPDADRLLVEIAPILRGVLRQYVAREQDRFTTSLAEETNRRMQIGWIALDRVGEVIASDTFGGSVLAGSQVIGRNANGKLVLADRNLEAEIFQTVRKMADDLTCRPHPILLQNDPWLDMLIVPARQKFIAPTGAPAVIAYVRGDNWQTGDRCQHLVTLFSLTSSEARLALSLCRGRSIAEAAAEVGLTFETARSYTKSIYTKTGAKSLPNLVRIVIGSVIAIAPECDTIVQ